ncbi:MAG TPA: phosphate acyltransferase PlsX [Alphaproteobacteria bacterium]|nr:phosphate acyltransferase PlsX [Alphaproteobacteria bacterium]
MTYRQIIALDAMGGDFGPSVTIPGAANALKKLKETKFLLFGDQRQINPLLENHPNLKKHSEVCHTDLAISSTDKPSTALRNGKGSSMRLAIEAVRDGAAHGVVSAGNTGALMVMSKLLLKSLPGISRPAIASVMPTMTGKVVMLDLGANLVCDAEVLTQFAVLGAVYARVVQGIPTPTVGLLNVGTEEMKGHEEIRAAAAILSSVKFPGRYYGFIEGNDITKGTVDVVVTDGFTGNVALKTAEGVGKLTKQFLTDAFKSSPLSLLGYLLSMRAMKKMKDKVDPRKYNGGMFLGVNGICVKSHGGSDILGTENAILVAADLITNGFNKRVADEIESLMSQESFVSVAGV